MNLIAILEINLRPDALEEARVIFANILGETSAFPGCLGVEVIVDRGDPTRWVAYERWESAEADAAYRTWRAGDGKRTDLGSLLAGPPVMTKYDPLAL